MSTQQPLLSRRAVLAFLVASLPVVRQLRFAPVVPVSEFYSVNYDAAYGRIGA